MIFQDELRGLFNGPSDRSKLNEHLWSRSTLAQHSLDGTNMSFYARKAIDDSFRLLVHTLVHDSLSNLTRDTSPRGDVSTCPSLREAHCHSCKRCDDLAQQTAPLSPEYCCPELRGQPQTNVSPPGDIITPNVRQVKGVVSRLLKKVLQFALLTFDG